MIMKFTYLPDMYPVCIFLLTQQHYSLTNPSYKKTEDFSSVFLMILLVFLHVIL